MYIKSMEHNVEMTPTIENPAIFFSMFKKSLNQLAKYGNSLGNGQYKERTFTGKSLKNQKNDANL